MRHLNREGYEEGSYAEEYGTLARLGPEERSFLDAFLEELPEEGTVIDLGCGNGVPFTRAVAATGRGVVGIDLAENHVAAARDTIPSGIFIRGDICRVLLDDDRFDDDRFDGAMMLFSLAHLPRERHADLFGAVHTILDGPLLVTVPGKERPPETGTIAGSRIAWNAWSPEATLDLLRDAGFSIMRQADLHEPEDEAMTYRWVLAGT